MSKRKQDKTNVVVNFMIAWKHNPTEQSKLPSLFPTHKTMILPADIAKK